MDFSDREKNGDNAIISSLCVYPFQWSELEEMNTDDVEEEFKNRLANIVTNKCCCLVYTVRRSRRILELANYRNWNFFRLFFTVWNRRQSEGSDDVP